ncbi:DUF421 domain-containing protein [Bacillus sp. S/N-304-OC-R1]|uniref:DUF421 domain-containing protein n=1 Tax=Bacillus sp. S/N-304-OC-R1 TaxID=2758034 RepID=UPI001C8E9AA3|nr:DUF421 domain-containing protein [Bacillus sp. S/N-304-OC-R1]MBY0123743.1 DUF421 domain-containing protein [Bacillus sp. S/N-304-OC-R1]
MDLVLIVILRTFVSFLILLIASVWIGKHINSHINHYNFALSVTIGSFIANMGFDTYLKFIPMTAAFLSLIAVYYFVLVITSKNRRLRKWLSGQPTVIIENGKILDQNMKKVKYNLDDLNQQLREKEIFDLNEVEFAVLEVSGKMSVMKKTRYQNAMKQDINPIIQNKTVNLPRELIMDGKVIGKNFTTQYTDEWLHHEIKKRHLQVQDIQYAVISSNGALFIDLFDDHLVSPSDIE